jgi:hypothetical protein
MNSIDPVKSAACFPASRAVQKTVDTPVENAPVDSVGLSGNQGLDLKKAAKIVSYESENLPEAITLWKFETKHYDSRAYISTGGHFYEGGLDGTLRRFSSDGSILWGVKTGHNDLSVTPAVASDGTVYVSRVVALEAYNPDGTRRWDLPLPGAEGMDRNSLKLELAVGPEGNAYIHDATRLFAIDPKGKVRWSKDLQTWGVECPAVRPDGSVYAMDRQNVLYCFDSTGKRLWINSDLKNENSHLPDISTNLIVGPDGTVYFAILARKSPSGIKKTARSSQSGPTAGKNGESPQKQILTPTRRPASIRRREPSM